ncbi:MAG: ACT domain-containing protein [Clostridia bacterium]|nr:ACT domain-containing protein [Clostridia bacterium]
MLTEDREVILVDAKVLPEVFIKVLISKRLLESGEVKTVNEACEKTGISRSAYYKYKDHVFDFNQMQGVLTLMAVVVDLKGVLSEILRIISSVNCSVMTINQSVPTDGIANIHLTVKTDLMKISVDKLITEITKVAGVRSVKILAKQ